MGTVGARLAFDDRTCLAVQTHPPRTGLAVAKIECVVSNFIPFQIPDLSATASSVEEEAYDVGLSGPGPLFLNAPVQFFMQTYDLVPGKETVEPCGPDCGGYRLQG